MHYNPYVPYTPSNIITYTASEKLPETTSDKNGGLHINAFNTTITSHTFEGSIGTIEFAEDVTSIGNKAFYGCSKLTSITIPNSVTSIGTYAFQSCASLANIDIPNSVTSIGNYAVGTCVSLTSVTIPNSVTSIGDGVFDSCKRLASVTIPNSVTSIGNGAFNRCAVLTSMEIPNSVTSIGNYAFRNCSSLTSITSNATTAPTIQSDTFKDVKTDGTLYVPIGSSGYDTWMGTGDYYLGKYNWTKVEQ